MDSLLVSSFPVDLPKGDNKISLYYKKQSQSYQRASVLAAELQRFTCLRIISHLFQHSFFTCCASFTHAYKVSFIVVRHKFHHGDTIISPWWENSFTMVKLTKDTEGKNIRRMGKEQETREKECGNLLDKERKQGSRDRGFIQNLPLLALENTWHQMWI